MGISEFTQNSSEQIQSNPKLSWISSFCWFVVSYFLLFLRWGYSFGDGDQVEILPYALKMINPNLYLNDFFINHIFTQSYNQRWAVASLLSQFGDLMPIATFVLFCISLFFLVRGIL
ncbi:MAG: hypothetical protein HKP14_04650, partial [Bacteroidia bacterium]|nr:hypothetical protein [Bacteroidia bacterium]